MRAIMRLKRASPVLTLVAFAAAASAGCAVSTTKTVTAPNSATAAAADAASTAPVDSAGAASASNASSSAPAPRPQVFHGSGQQDLGTIVVPTDSTISWNCPSCGNTNFIVNNAHSDTNNIPTNALDQTTGVDPLPAGTYHTVVVDTTGGPWTVAIGGNAPTPTGPAPSSGSSAPFSGSAAAFSQCDPNISVSGADCQFAENTFYEYWINHGASSFSVYSPTDQTFYTVNCGSGAAITCSTGQGAAVNFSQASVARYTQSEASSYASSHAIGP